MSKSILLAPLSAQENMRVRLCRRFLGHRLAKVALPYALK